MYYNSFDNIGLVKVLSFLKSHDTEYLSGQDLSDVLKISRVAVWKHIRTIKDIGYTVETRQKLGYRLVADTKKLVPWEVVRELKTRRVGKKAHYFDEIDSTQRYALSIASGDEDGSVVIAESQTHGTGRQHRRWESPVGGIWCSLVIKPDLDGSALALVPIAVAVALSKAIKRATGIDTELKWPNDVTIKSKKVAGIITDAAVESGVIQHIVIGIGINFDVDVKQLAKKLQNTDNFYGMTSVLSHADADKRHMLQVFFEEIEDIISGLEQNKTDAIIKEWTKRSSTIGKKVTVTLDGKKISGIATEIDSDGLLVIRDGGDTVRVLADDVTYLR